MTGLGPTAVELAPKRRELARKRLNADRRCEAPVVLGRRFCEFSPVPLWGEFVAFTGWAAEATLVRIEAELNRRVTTEDMLDRYGKSPAVPPPRGCGHHIWCEGGS